MRTHSRNAKKHSKFWQRMQQNPRIRKNSFCTNAFYKTRPALVSEIQKHHKDEEMHELMVNTNADIVEVRYLQEDKRVRARTLARLMGSTAEFGFVNNVACNWSSTSAQW